MNVRRALALIFLGLSFGSLFSGGIVEGTVIHTSMHDFSQKKLVEELVPGDFVISFDFKKSMFCQSKVAEKNIKEVYQIVEIILEAGGVEEKIYTTVDEKIYLPRCWEWREAQKLKAGQFLQRYPLASIPIKEINILNKTVQIVELKIEEFENFCAGNFEILTHNFREEFISSGTQFSFPADGSIIKTQMIAAAVIVADAQMQRWTGRCECVREVIPKGCAYPDPNLTKRFSFNHEFMSNSHGFNYDLPISVKGCRCELDCVLLNNKASVNSLFTEDFKSPTKNVEFVEAGSGKAFVDDKNNIWLKQQDSNHNYENVSWKVFGPEGNPLAAFNPLGNIQFMEASFAQELAGKEQLNNKPLDRNLELAKLLPPQKYGPFKSIKYHSALDDERNRWLAFFNENNQHQGWKVYLPSGDKLADVSAYGVVSPIGFECATKRSPEDLKKKTLEIENTMQGFFENISSNQFVEMLEDFQNNPLMAPIFDEESVLIDGVPFPKSSLSKEELDRYEKDKKDSWINLKNSILAGPDKNSQSQEKTTKNLAAENSFLEPKVKEAIQKLVPEIAKYVLCKSFGKLVAGAMLSDPLMKMLLDEPPGPMRHKYPTPIDKFFSPIVEKAICLVVDQIIKRCPQAWRILSSLPIASLISTFSVYYTVISFVRDFYPGQFDTIDTFIENKFGPIVGKIFKNLTGLPTTMSEKNKKIKKENSELKEKKIEQDVNSKRDQEALAEKNKQLEAKDQQLQAKDQQIAQEKEEKNKQLEAKDQQLQAKDQQLEAKDQQLEAKDQQIAQEKEEKNQLIKFFQATQETIKKLNEDKK